MVAASVEVVEREVVVVAAGVPCAAEDVVDCGVHAAATSASPSSAATMRRLVFIRRQTTAGLHRALLISALASPHADRHCWLWSGWVGSDLALALSEEGHDVSVVEEDRQKLDALGSAFDGRTEVGLPYDVQTLRTAGIEGANAFVAVARSDNQNLMAVQVAKKVFGVPVTIARLDDPTRADAYRALDVHYVPGSHLISV